MHQNSMTRHTNLDVVYDRVIASYRTKRRKGNNAVIILVEGSDDVIFYRSLLINKFCVIEACNGKENIPLVYQRLKIENYQVLCIFDADFGRLLGNLNASEDYLYTDTHDLETELMKSPALNKFLNVIFPQDKSIYLDAFISEIRNSVKTNSKVIGIVRLLLEKKCVCVDFDKLNKHSFMPKKKNEVIRLDRLVSEILDKNGDCRISHEHFEKAYNDESENQYDDWQVIQGHDLLLILQNQIVILIRAYIRGEAEIKKIKESYLHPEDRLRIHLINCYESEYFRRTGIYQEICRWQEEKKETVIE